MNLTGDADLCTEVKNEVNNEAKNNGTSYSVATLYRSFSHPSGSLLR